MVGGSVETTMKKLKDINWNQVYYFYEVARKMSMKEAAEVTGVSIPTVSEQIKRLETLLETPLFHRRPRRIELTVEGEILFQHAKQMFESGLRFLDVVSPTLIGGYPVRVGIQESFANTVALEFLERYYDLYSPFGTIHTLRETISDRLIEQIHLGHIDWGMTTTAPQSGRLEYGRIGAAEVLFWASPQKLEEHRNRVGIFQEMPLARSRWDEQLNKQVFDHLQSLDVFIEETIDSDHAEFCLQLAEQGKCVVAQARTPALEARSARLRSFSIGGPILIPFFAVWRQSSQRMIAIRKLIDIIERENKGTRGRPSPIPSTGGSGTSGPGAGAGPGAGPGGTIELPHRFEAADWISKTTEDEPNH